ncbi:hypothetical protein ACFQHV_14015 [Promicromonospora thailandica]|uniref:Uncharacterized protein n=1 Tax=Promicromonospora thailandica TaxID=765201 RepID=A0A9X2K073_9MICO|nr:hypothetical protein [Promicromonospora thailandica]MCP2266794.1 hypothetical protein [Promicromonospora thailandica]BFF21962.1 hypothetical protein GCM10025730_54830 [Promicromonospora thailandica]
MTTVENPAATTTTATSAPATSSPATSAPATYEEIGPRICVTPPYYALGDLTVPVPGLALATVPVQTPTGRQVPVINIAEAGRHLAILGLCAAASTNPAPGRHYYLAHRGVGRMYPPSSGTAGSAGVLHGTATARMSGRNRAVAQTELRDAGGSLVARLDMEYLVMSEPVFRRLMGPATAPDAAGPANPFAAPAPLTGVAAGARGGTAELTVEPTLCRGHFTGHPALPVSVAGYATFALFDHVLEAAAGPDARWQPGSYRLRADHLAAAGRTCAVEVTPSAPAEPEQHDRAFTGTLRSGSRDVFTIEVDYTVV